MVDSYTGKFFTCSIFMIPLSSMGVLMYSFGSNFFVYVAVLKTYQCM